MLAVMATSSYKAVGNDRFNDDAAAWDSNPDVHKASASALTSILYYFPTLQSYKNGTTPTGLDVLEIGCGTGLLSFMVAPYVRSLTAVDVAEGMIAALKIKLEKQPEVRNILPVYAILEDPDDELIRLDPGVMTSEVTKELPPRRFDLILSHLVLHHIPSLKDVLATMFGCLKSGGRVALTDFEDFGPEAKKFHPENKLAGVERHGIPRTGIEKLLKEAGFADVRIETAFVMDKKVEKVSGKGLGEDNSEIMVFPFLICMGRKP